MAINGMIEPGLRVELDVTPDCWHPYRLSEQQFGAAIAAVIATKMPVTEVRASFRYIIVVVMVPRDDVPSTVKLREMRARMIAAAKNAIGPLPSLYGED